MAFRRKLCQTEVENLGMAALRDEDVGWFDVPVDYSLSVGCVQAVCNLNPEALNLLAL